MRFEKVSKEQYIEDAENDTLYANCGKIIEKKPIRSDDLDDIYSSIKLPQRATAKSAGYDIYAPYDFTLAPGETIKMATGIRVILDSDKFLMCAPRSGHGFKARMQLDNTIGIIDADYSDSDNEGHIMMKLTNDSHTGKYITVKQGEGMAQAIILSYYTVEDDSATAQRNGGFGSTTKN